MDCHSKFDAEKITFNGRQLFAQTFCPACLDKRVEESERNRDSEVLEGRRNAFWAEVPRLYSDTEKVRLHGNLIAAIDRWEYSPKGLGMIGESGAGKTRAAVEILFKEHDMGKTVCFMKATKLTQHAQDKFNNDDAVRHTAEIRLRKAYTAKLLLLDDLGKGRLPASAEELLYDLIDERSERGLPIIWTSNANGKELNAMLSADRGQAILRRLVDFSTIVTI
jgi:DNA replication protein DnaC